MKFLKEQTTIKNFTTKETTVIDDEGNITELEDTVGDDAFDFFADAGFGDEGGDNHGLRPDGTPDGLDDEFGDDFDMFGGGDEGGMFGEEPTGEENPFGEELPPEEGELGGDENPFGEEEEQEQDPDFQGVIRTVTGACLVFKRKGEEGTYDELWMYNVGKNMRTEAKIRRSILSGTDIDIQDVSSEDGTQKCVTSTIGNVQYLKITGLPN